MLRPTLANEFGTSGSPEYDTRQEAFDRYNTLLKRDPQRVADVLGALATGRQANTADAHTRGIVAATEAIFTATNNGTQIGFDPKTREAAWAIVHEDDGHTKAARAYNTLPAEGRSTEEGIRLCRMRGLHTLKAVALLHAAEGGVNTGNASSSHSAKSQSIAA